MFFDLLFFIFSSIILTSGLIVISARNPIHSVLFLILVFVNVVFLLLLLEVEFLALTFIIVYVGAVAVLFLFVVMMLNIKIVELNNELIHYFPIGGLMGLIFLIDIFLITINKEMIPVLNFELMNQFTYLNWFEQVDCVNNIEVMGQLLYTYYFFFFLLSAVVLLIAMIGAIVLTTRQKDKDVYYQEIYQQLSRNSQNAIFTVSLKN
jgi:NADH-quinone oxidoreductase subunit J